MPPTHFPRIAARLLTEPWTIETGAFASILSQFQSAAERNSAHLTPRHGMFGDGDDAEKGPRQEIYGGVAYVPVHGVLAKHLSMMESLCGGYDLATLEQSMRQLAEDRAVDSVLLDIRSPGGAAAGMPEAVAAIESVRTAGKRVVAFTDDMAASGAYWLAAAADEIVATPSARLGSISTFWAGVDSSAAWASEGLRRILITTGRFKGMGVEGAPWSEDWLAEISRHVAETDASFKGYIAERRGLGTDEMQGQTWAASSAPQRLVDRIVAGIDDVLADLQAAGMA